MELQGSSIIKSIILNKLENLTLKKIVSPFLFDKKNGKNYQAFTKRKNYHSSATF